MLKSITLLVALIFALSCQDATGQNNAIALEQWRITLPVDKDLDGKPDNYGPDEMHQALTDGSLKPYFYLADDGALVFYCERNKDLATTPNSKYPRSELREHMIPGDYHTNWSMDQGGVLSGKLQVTKSTTNDCFMVMQIHGRLTRDQRQLIGKKDYDAPPLLKIYYNNGQIEVAYKVLKDKNYTGVQLLQKSNWTDAEHYFFKNSVNHQPFKLSISANRNGFIVTLNGEVKEFLSEDLEKWPFMNYFKAGNYLTSSRKSAISEVKFYQLEIKH